MIIVGDGLLQLINDGVIDALPENIHGHTIDVRLGDEFWDESLEGDVYTLKGLTPEYEKHSIGNNGYFLPPNGFCLAITMEYFNMPANIRGAFYMKSSHARAGLNHSQAILIKPGWSGNLVLELKNDLELSTHVLVPGQLIGQVEFMLHETTESYDGKYNNQLNIKS